MLQKRSLVLAAALVAGAATVAALSGCAAPSVSTYAGETPALDLARYFNGRVTAHGMFQDRFGKIAKRFTVTIDGQWTGNQGVLDESFTYSDGTTGTRVWRLTQHPDGRVTGTADDVVGEAEGRMAGNTFHWTYTLRQPIGDKVYEVQMDDWMVLIDDRVLLNRASMHKFGVLLGELTVSFSRP
jgi:hypothetical protein